MVAGSLWGSATSQNGCMEESELDSDWQLSGRPQQETRMRMRLVCQGIWAWAAQRIQTVDWRTKLHQRWKGQQVRQDDRGSLLGHVPWRTARGPEQGPIFWNWDEKQKLINQEWSKNPGTRTEAHGHCVPGNNTGLLNYHLPSAE